jgi:hypothetical protein
MCDRDAAARCVGIAATGVWAGAWLAAAGAAVRRAVQAPDVAAWLGAGVAVLMVGLCSWVIVRLLRRGHPVRGTGSVAPFGYRPVREPWPRRLVGYLALVLWLGAAVVWNVGFIGRLVEAADQGEGWWMLVLIPWSLLGWLLLFILFTSVGVMIGWLLTVLRRILFERR